MFYRKWYFDVPYIIAGALSFLLGILAPFFARPIMGTRLVNSSVLFIILVFITVGLILLQHGFRRPVNKGVAVIKHATC